MQVLFADQVTLVRDDDVVIAHRWRMKIGMRGGWNNPVSIRVCCGHKRRRARVKLYGIVVRNRARASRKAFKGCRQFGVGASGSENWRRVDYEEESGMALNPRLPMGPWPLIAPAAACYPPAPR